MLCCSEYHGGGHPIVMLQGSGSGSLAVDCDITMLVVSLCPLLCIFRCCQSLAQSGLCLDYC